MLDISYLIYLFPLGFVRRAISYGFFGQFAVRVRHRDK